MVFSSLTFLCIFLPVILILDRVLPGVRTRNVMLLIASLIFYAYGEPVCVLLMIASCILNYIWALLIGNLVFQAVRSMMMKRTGYILVANRPADAPPGSPVKPW